MRKKVISIVADALRPNSSCMDGCLYQPGILKEWIGVNFEELEMGINERMNW